MSESKTYDVTAIGNAIVDVLAQADDALLAAHNLPKGAMNLIDAEAAEKPAAKKPAARKPAAKKPAARKR